jgi:hypothetical protein
MMSRKPFRQLQWEMLKHILLRRHPGKSNMKNGLAFWLPQIAVGVELLSVFCLIFSNNLIFLRL